MTTTPRESLPTRRLYRASNGRLVAGVAAGLAEHLGVDVLLVRVAFVILAATGGAGILMYGAFWVFAPQRPEGQGEGPSRRNELATLLALAALCLGGVLLLSSLGLGIHPGLAVPLVAVGFGVVLVWRQADEDQRERLRAATGSRRWYGVARTAVGIALVVVAGGAILFGPADLGGTVGGVVAALVITCGLALLTGPWWIRMARDLSAERSARIRAQERAEVAAHVHDSVLHTLTLIQRHVDDPREVTRLARAQERELRSWLYRSPPEADRLLDAALEWVAAEVEDAHGVAVEVVVVGGSAPVDERLQALLHATREALVNAAKYAGGSPISVYAEVEPDKVSVFVRDRGPGFDLAAVPEDRLGLRQSVIGRMQRHGGSATIRTGAGEGTEVELEMPRNDKP